jgi:putative cardiolipin synthase
VALLRSPEEAMSARVNLLESAEDEVLISYFIFEQDRSGLTYLSFLEELIRDRPGMRIKILLDNSTKGLDRSLIAYLESLGIEVRFYHAFRLKNDGRLQVAKPFINLTKRLHDKLTIVDQRFLVAGGRNIGDGYFDKGPFSFLDLDVWANSEKVALEARKYFLELWESQHVFKVKFGKRHLRPKRMAQARQLLENHRQFLEKSNFLNLGQRDHLTLNLHPVEPEAITFHHAYDWQSSRINPRLMSKQLFDRLSMAKKRLMIATPYLLPTETFYKTLYSLREKGVEVKILTNSLCSSDVLSVSAAYSSHRRFLLEMGVELYEFKGPSSLHIKSWVYDYGEKSGGRATIGSFNLDPRSSFLNSETIVEVEDQQLADELARSLWLHFENSSKLTINDKGKIEGKFNECQKTPFSQLLYGLYKLLGTKPFFYNQL